MTGSEPVLTERRDGVLLITLNRPEVRNALDAATADLLAAAFDALDADDGLTVGVLTGAGPAFCAGMDLKAFASGGRIPWVEGRGFGGFAQRTADKPLIAAVEGFAVAGGLELALACDMLVAAEGSRLGVPEVKRSLVAGAGALLRLPERLPQAVATEMVLTGEPITAERAHALGLVNRLTPAGGALDEALRLAAAIAVNAPLALKASKEILTGRRDWTTAEFWERQGPIAQPVAESDDAREGATAFAEKRAPVWRGR